MSIMDDKNQEKEPRDPSGLSSGLNDLSTNTNTTSNMTSYKQTSVGMTSNKTFDQTPVETTSNVESDMMECEKCKKRILVWEFPEHADFHYAKEVQDSMKKDFLSLYSHSSQRTPPVKKKDKNGNTSMRKYFSPAMKKL